MAQNTEQIILEFITKGQEQLVAAKAELAKANETIKDYKKKVDEASDANEKHDSSLRQAGKSIKSFRSELFALTFTIAAVSGAIIALSKQSDALGFQVERTGDSFRALGSSLGNIVARSSFVEFINNMVGGLAKAADAADKFLAKLGLVSNSQDKQPRSVQIQELSFRAQTAQLSGDREKAILLQHQAEMLKLEEIGDTKRRDQFKAFYQERLKIQQENLRNEQAVERLGVEAEIATLRGDDALALRKRQDAELLELRRTHTGKDLAILESFYREKHELQERDLRLTQLGLKNQAQIFQDFQKAIVSGLKTETSGFLFNLFQGQLTGIKDVVNSIRSTLHKALADALSESLFSSLAGGGGFGDFFSNFGDALTGKDSKAERASKEIKDEVARGNRISEDIKRVSEYIQQCACATAQGISSLGGPSLKFSGNFSAEGGGGGSGIFGKLGSIFGGISKIGSVFTGGIGNIFGNLFGGGLPSGAGISLGGGPEGLPGFDFHHEGGPVLPKFATGGEVPIMAQPGEFVVRRDVAQSNMEFLKDMNSGNNSKSRGAMNVFLIKANDAQSFDSMLSTPSAQSRMEINIIKAISANGEIRRTIKNFATN